MTGLVGQVLRERQCHSHPGTIDNHVGPPGHTVAQLSFVSD